MYEPHELAYAEADIEWRVPIGAAAIGLRIPSPLAPVVLTVIDTHTVRVSGTRIAVDHAVAAYHIHDTDSAETGWCSGCDFEGSPA